MKTVFLASLVALMLPFHTVARASDELSELLAKPERAEQDRTRDAGRKPAEVVAFLGIQPGMTVMDLIAGGGYYTEVLSLAVGPTGKVYAQNTQRSLQVRQGANAKEIEARLANGRLANVERLDKDFAGLGLAPESLDAAVTALNYHDIYNGAGEASAIQFLRLIQGLLEPGGVLGIVDHIGDAGNDNAQLHRVELAKVRQAAEQLGFEIEASEILRNPEDDHTKSVFDPSIRGKTDRFVLKLRKPASTTP